MTEQVFHGRWWAPDGVRRFRNDACMGTLIIEENGASRLEVYHDQRNSAIFRVYEKYDVIWGETADGRKISVFRLEMINENICFQASFVAHAVLVGTHIKTGHEPIFDTCVINYPYLRNWAFEPKVKKNEPEEDVYDFTVDFRKKNHILAKVQIDSSTELHIYRHIEFKHDRFDTNITQATYLSFTTSHLSSPDFFVDCITEYSQFLSLALFSRQEPSEIWLKKSKSNHYCQLFYKVDKSVNPNDFSIIPFNKFKTRIPEILALWHQVYPQISQICHYLLSSINYDEFDVPDFLIVAQALDGYHKRFLNKKDGKDIKKYEDEINAMLKYFNNVESIQKCHIDSKMMADSRNKYSHLIPDEEDEGKNIARGAELFRLTQKAKILLSCCLLDLLGFSHSEIDTCFNSSSLIFLIDRIDFEETD